MTICYYDRGATKRSPSKTHNMEKQNKTQKIIGMGYDQVLGHTKRFKDFDSKSEYLWKVLDKKGMYSEKTKRSVLNVLEDSYDHDAIYNPWGSSTKKYGAKKLFCEGLLNGGHKEIGLEKLTQLSDKIQREIEDVPRVGRYVDHRSSYGCGYEDVRTSYEGLYPDELAGAHRRYDKKLPVLTEMLTDVTKTLEKYSLEDKLDSEGVKTQSTERRYEKNE